MLIDTHAHEIFRKLRNVIENEIRDEAELAAQSAAFEQHLGLAAAAGKSAVIHQRDSWEDTIEVLRKHSTRIRAVMHSEGHPAILATDAEKLQHCPVEPVPRRLLLFLSLLYAKAIVSLRKKYGKNGEGGASMGKMEKAGRG